MEILGIPFEVAAGGGISGAAVIAVLSGLLVPYRTLRDSQMESRTWREAYERERENRERMDRALSELTAQGEATIRIINSLPPFENYERRGRDVRNQGAEEQGTE